MDELVYEYIQFVIGVMIISIPYAISLYVLSKEILNEHLKKRIGIIFTIVFCVFQLFINFGLQLGWFFQGIGDVTVAVENPIILIQYEVIVFTIQSMFLVLILWISKVKNFLRIFTVVTIAYFFVQTFFGVVSTIVVVLFNIDMETISFETYEMLNYTVHLFLMVLSILIAWFLRKIQFGYKLESIFANRKKLIVLCVVSFIAKDSFMIFTYIGELRDPFVHIVLSTSIIIVVFVLLFYIAIAEANKQKINGQNAIILQNEVNVKSLEKLQQEFRMLRHDFKNMLSGIYLHMNKGDSEAIELFVKDASDRFDRLSDQKIEKADEVSIELISPKASNVLENFRLYMKKIIQLPRTRYLLFLILSAIAGIVTFILLYYPKHGTNLGIALMGIFVFSLITLMGLSVLNLNKSKLESQKILLESQLAYTENLQKTQKEISPIIENYKLMLSKIAIDAHDGRFDEMQRLIVDTTTQMDDRINLEIRKTAQLDKIKIIEVRSLVLTKILKMTNLNIKYNLEIILPINTLGMVVEDFNRCLGILIDNAIEACLNIPDSFIDILLLEENNTLNIVVKNSAKEASTLKEVYQEGFSTKGSGRGLGLASYKRILSRYENTYMRTLNKNGVFVQELRIGG